MGGWGVGKGDVSNTPPQPAHQDIAPFCTYRSLGLSCQVVFRAQQKISSIPDLIPSWVSACNFNHKVTSWAK